MPDLLISDQDKLDALTERLAESTRLVLDTEFVREKTYHPQACLLQIATGDTLACVDLRAPLDFGTIGPVLLNRDSTKVIHAARQDLEIFYRFPLFPLVDMTLTYHSIWRPALDRNNNQANAFSLRLRTTF